MKLGSERVLFYDSEMILMLLELDLALLQSLVFLVLQMVYLLFLVSLDLLLMEMLELREVRIEHC